jgi:hypothetical protein
VMRRNPTAANDAAAQPAGFVLSPSGFFVPRNELEQWAPHEAVEPTAPPGRTRSAMRALWTRTRARLVLALVVLDLGIRVLDLSTAGFLPPIRGPWFHATAQPTVVDSSPSALPPSWATGLPALVTTSVMRS